MRLVTAHRLLIGAAMAGAVLYGTWAVASYLRGGAYQHLLGAVGAGAGLVLLGVYYKVYVRRLAGGRER